MVIVGGGINGCALAREAARAGLRTALLEKLDFGAGVTSRSTRLIHGGLRYLESFNLPLVLQSLRDRVTLLREFPGQVQPQPFLLPIYATDSRPPWYIAAGLALYRLLATGSGLPPSRRLSAAESLDLLGGLDPEGLLSSFEYYDCQAAYPERLALEMALQAEEAGADVRNHARVCGLAIRDSRVEAVQFDGPEGSGELQCKLVVNAAGAWIDQILSPIRGTAAEPLLTLINGTHIVVRQLPGAPRHAVYHEARSDRRPFFIVPWLGLHLIGTTETRFSGNPDVTVPAEADIQYLIEEACALLPGAGISRDDILYAYCGPRPVLNGPSGDLNRASRGEAVVDHEGSDGIRGLLTMAGGKLTTAPSFARKALRRAAGKLGVTSTRAVPPKSPSLGGVDPRLAQIYGPRAPQVCRFLEADPELARPLAAGCQTTRGEVLFAAKFEHARTLADILLRRTGAAFNPCYERSWAELAAEIAAEPLGWDQADTVRALAEYEIELAQTLVRV